MLNFEDYSDYTAGISSIVNFACAHLDLSWDFDEMPELDDQTIADSITLKDLSMIIPE